MGNTVQKILPGRGDKKRQNFRIRIFFPLVLLFLTYLGLLLEFPLKKTIPWFLLSLATVALYALLHIFGKERKQAVEFLFALALPVAGMEQLFSMLWLKMTYFPFMTALTAFYGQRTVLSLLALLPFLEIRNLAKGSSLYEQIVFFLFLTVTVSVSLLIRKRMIQDDTDESVFDERKASGNGVHDTATKTFDDEKIVADYLETMFRPDEEIREMLAAAKNTVVADSVSLFLRSGERLRLRCSTDDSGGIIPSDRGLIHVCLAEKKALVFADILEKKLDIGYLKKEPVSSLVAVPVIDSNFPLGVIAADSIRFHAFSSADSDILQMFARQIMRVLQRERVYPQIHRSHEKLKVLNEESSRLLSSLDIGVIAQNLIDGAARIAPSAAAFFAAKSGEFELLSQRGLHPGEKKTFSLKGTLLDMAVKNRQCVHLSDVRECRSPIMPLKTGEAGSVLAMPLIYEKELQGILVLVAEKTNAFTPYQIELLGVLGNQASTSIANARFHAKIEKLALTDGLTGLFNHRHFQERLSLEFSRLQRFSEPLSLLLIDIDYFKKINDAYGHPVGDAVLRGVGAKIRKTIRNIDIPARYGGEEFAVILLGTDRRGAMNMAERLRKTVMNTKFTAEKESFAVTVSIGIATYPDGIGSKEEFIERADKALYQAKKNGRNQSIIWSDVSVHS